MPCGATKKYERNSLKQKAMKIARNSHKESDTLEQHASSSDPDRDHSKAE